MRQSLVRLKMPAPPKIRFNVISMNVLSPGYFRKTDRSDKKKRVEAQHAHAWQPRLRQQCRVLADLDLDIATLQEFWFKREVFDLVHDALGSGYMIVAAQRSGKKEDGVALLVRKERWQILSDRSIHLDDGHGDRSLALVLIQSRVSPECPPVIVATTHLTYPHDAHDAPIRLQQAAAIARHIDEFASDAGAQASPVVLTGDFNGPCSDPAVRLLLDHGFASSFSACHGREAAITHLDHAGHASGVDFVFYRQGRRLAEGGETDAPDDSAQHGSSSSSPVATDAQAPQLPVLQPLSATLLPECTPDDAMMTRPVVQHAADLAAAASALEGCGEVTPAAEAGLLGSHRIGSPVPLSPASSSVSGNSGHFGGEGASAHGSPALPPSPGPDSGLFAVTRPLSELSFADWCQLTDHRAVKVCFELQCV